MEGYGTWYLRWNPGRGLQLWLLVRPLLLLWRPGWGRRALRRTAFAARTGSWKKYSDWASVIRLLFLWPPGWGRRALRRTASAARTGSWNTEQHFSFCSSTKKFYGRLGGVAGHGVAQLLQLEQGPRVMPVIGSKLEPLIIFKYRK